MHWLLEFRTQRNWNEKKNDRTNEECSHLANEHYYFFFHCESQFHNELAVCIISISVSNCLVSRASIRVLYFYSLPLCFVFSFHYQYLHRLFLQILCMKRLHAPNKRIHRVEFLRPVIRTEFFCIANVYRAIFFTQSINLPNLHKILKWSLENRLFCVHRQINMKKLC